MIRTATLPATAVLILTMFAPTAEAAGETCQGVAATLVGAPQSRVTGTEGRDVVVTAGASAVDTGGGEDLICVRGGVKTFVSTGAGEDLVDATEPGPTNLRVVLGSGHDAFEGAAATLEVWADSSLTLGPATDNSVDVIRVAAMPGARTLVQTGQIDLPNADVIRLAGSGDVRWSGTMAPGAELAGGVGDNRLMASLPTGDVAVDLAAGTATGTGPGRPELRWSGFESYSFSDRAQAATDLEVAGTRGDDLVDLVLFSGLRTAVALGSGDDILNTTAVGAAGSSYRGGGGRDRLGVAAWGNVDLDLAAGTMRAVANGLIERADVASFQDAHVWGRRVHIVGDDGTNALTASGCRGSRVSGRGGSDRIEYDTHSPVDPRACSNVPAARFDGGRGNDRIVGGPGDDRLIGGPGQDAVRGLGGRDACEGEARRTCETRA